MDSKDQKRRWRPRLRFSLRTLMIAMTVVCVFLGYRVHRARVQRDAVAVLNEASVSLEYDWWLAGLDSPPGPDWIMELIGREYFQEVESAEVYDFEWSGEESVFDQLARLPRLKRVEFYCDFDRRHLEKLTGLKHLERLTLNFYPASITDSTMACLGRLHALKSLNLSQAEITSAGVQHLAGLNNLETLDLSETRITDDDLVYVGRLRALRKLNLDDTDITDAGLAHLSELHELTEFSAVGQLHRHYYDRVPLISLGDEALRLLGRHKKLTKLNIGINVWRGLVPPRISGAGLKHLVDLPLTDLTLMNADLEDADLVTLKRFQSLEHVYFDGDRITQENAKAVGELLPNVIFGASGWEIWEESE